MSLGRRVRQAREDAGLTQRHIATAVGKSPQAVSGWERGKNDPTNADLVAISSLTGADLHWLTYGELHSLDSHSSSHQSWRGREVPSVEWNELSHHLNGNGRISGERRARSHFECGPRSFQSMVSDRSNEPEIKLHDSVIVDRDRKPSPGDIVLVSIRGEFMLRRYRPRGKCMELAPCNPDWPTETVEKDHVIFGVVTEVARRRG